MSKPFLLYESEEETLLTESQVRDSFHQLFRGGNWSQDDFEQAEHLIDELRPESPLRIKLINELDEIRKLKAAAT